MSPSIAAILPMRHQSERVPGKNYREFAGRPLYHYIAETLLSCPEIDSVLIDSDSDLILEDAGSNFPEIILYRRPQRLCGGMTSMNDVLLNSVTQVEADYYFQTHSTNPLLRSSTIGEAIKIFHQSVPHHDSLFSVTRLHSRLWNANAQPLNHDPNQLLRTQDLEPVFEENSCIYLFSSESLKKRCNRIGARPKMFEIARLEAQDIDTEDDFYLAEALYKQYRTPRENQK